MKWTLNVFQGKKPSLEEGPIIYSANEAGSVIITRTAKDVNSKRCIQLLKFLAYTVLMVAIFFIGLTLLSHWMSSSRMCGLSVDRVEYDYYYDENSNKIPISDIAWSSEAKDMITILEPTYNATIMVNQTDPISTEISTTSSPKDEQLYIDMVLARLMKVAKDVENLAIDDEDD